MGEIEIFIKTPTICSAQSNDYTDTFFVSKKDFFLLA